MHVTGAWVSSVARKGDILLMDYFISLRPPDKTLRILNRCRIYLKVLTLSDITSADGNYILSSVKRGEVIQECNSALIWPVQEKPGKLIGSCGLKNYPPWKKTENSGTHYQHINNGTALLIEPLCTVIKFFLYSTHPGTVLGR